MPDAVNGISKEEEEKKSNSLGLNKSLSNFWILFCMVRDSIEGRECLLSFDAESVVFQVAIQKLKDQDI